MKEHIYQAMIFDDENDVINWQGPLSPDNRLNPLVDINEHPHREVKIFSFQKVNFGSHVNLMTYLGCFAAKKY
jgi:hypothetical protein